MDELCKHADAFEATIPNLSADQLDAANTVLSYCKNKTIPDYAAKTLAERDARLAQAAGLVNVAESTLGSATQALEYAAVDYLDAIAARVASDSMLRTGAAADLLVGELVGEVCKGGVEIWLRETCAPLGSGAPLPQLRRRLVADVVNMPLQAAAKNISIPDQQRARLEAAFALLRAATSPAGVHELVARLAQSTLPDAVKRWCSADDGVPPARDPLATAAYALSRILADGVVLDRPDAYYRAVVETRWLVRGRPRSPKRARPPSPSSCARSARSSRRKPARRPASMSSSPGSKRSWSWRGAF